MVVKCADFQPERYFSKPPLLKNRKGNPGGKKRHYIGITTAFDIETTLIDSVQQSVMYIWQWQFGEDYTVIGRTWDEFLDLQKLYFSTPRKWDHRRNDGAFWPLHG